MNRRILLLLAILGVCDSATALDAGCEAILEASAARMAQSAWHSVTELAGGTRMETIKAGGKFYRRLAAYGQVGFTDPAPPWEETPVAEKLREDLAS